MVPVEQLKAAVEQLPKWSPQITSRISWVNWRQGFQIKAHWYGNCSLLCYLDFKDSVARDDTLATAFKRFAAPGARPRVIHGHGWSCLDYSFPSDHFVSINELAEIVDAKGYAYTVLYVQECVGARPLFEILGIPLVPGEMGKEWVGGKFIS
ncbi:hypothetical protein HBN99_21555 [Pseudomonas oryzihabitans]|uniref:hypothetical protein n=1 Tax=Pseudomonas oryzihabitans TaxID=47885 RepID=UPI001473AF6F|nr:hypothetical protein [Pseudomonas oryzihabitans]NMZ66910.1 hypothetical protein [Pseudomonas oryzihabitans]